MRHFAILLAILSSVSRINGDLYDNSYNQTSKIEKHEKFWLDSPLIEDSWNFYQRLNISPDCSFQEIKRSYRHQIIYFHPDKLIHIFTEEEKEIRLKQFLLIQEAYETLSNPTKRSIYDDQLRQNQENPTNDNNNRHRNEIWNPEEKYFTNSILKFYATARNMKISLTVNFPPLDVPDIIIPVSVPLDLYFNGGEKNTTYRRRRTCPLCSGTGAKQTFSKTCEDCSGLGYYWKKFQQGRYSQMIYCKCEKCLGKGFTIIKKCPQCGGAGHIYDESWFSVLVPCGFFPNQQFLYPSLGHEYNGKFGDLVVELLYDLPKGYSVENNSSNLIYHHNTSLATLQQESEFILHHFLGDSLKVSVPAGINAEDILNGYEIRQEKLGLYLNESQATNRSVYTRPMESLYDFNSFFCKSEERGDLIVKLSINWNEVSAKEMIENMMVRKTLSTTIMR